MEYLKVYEEFEYPGGEKVSTYISKPTVDLFGLDDREKAIEANWEDMMAGRHGISDQVPNHQSEVRDFYQERSKGNLTKEVIAQFLDYMVSSDEDYKNLHDCMALGDFWYWYTHDKK